MEYIDLNEKIKLLTLVEKNVEDTGKFSYSSFVRLLSLKENKKDEQPLSDQECFELLSLVEQQVNTTGRFDYLPFIEQIGKTLKPSRGLQENQESVTETGTPSVNKDSESSVNSRDETVSISVESSSKSDAIISSSEKIESKNIEQPTEILPEQEPVNVKKEEDKGEEQELQRLQRIQYLERLYSLVMREVEKTGKFPYHPFENLIVTVHTKKPVKTSQELRLLELVCDKVEMTGKFNYPDFIGLFSDANKYILVKQNLRAALKDITEGVNGLRVLITEFQDKDYQQEQKLLQLISQGTHHLETILQNYCPSPKKSRFYHQTESPLIVRLRERLYSICLNREIVYQQVMKPIDIEAVDNSHLLSELSKLQIYSTDVVMLLEQWLNVKNECG